MISAQLLHEARLRAGISKAELGRRVGLPGNVIGRWERGEVQPSLERLTGLVRACELDLTLGLARADESNVPLIDAKLTLSPTERVEGAAASSAFVRRTQGRAGAFEPARIFRALYDARVSYVLIGDLAAVVHGAPYPADDVDVTLRPGIRNRRRLARALSALGGATEDELPEAGAHETEAGRLIVDDEPPGSHGFADLIRDAEWTELHGTQVAVAALKDVIRCAEAANRPTVGTYRLLARIADRAGAGRSRSRPA